MFVHLHNHTKYSLLDSISKPEDIITKLKSLSQNTFAITDHGHCYNHPEISKQFSKADMKMIIGCEMYICDDIEVRDKDSKYNHLVLLAKNEIGRRNLNQLISKANFDGFYYKPRIDFNILSQHSEGLICLSACMAGEIQRTLKVGEFTDSTLIAQKYKKLFGSDYYLEIQAHSEPEQLKLNSQVVTLANFLNIPIVVTCDTHYVNKQDQKMHGIFVQIGQQREVGEIYSDCYIMSESEVYDIIINSISQYDANMAIFNTNIIAEQCNATVPFSAPIIPHIDLPPEYKSEADYLKSLCNKGWNNRAFNVLSQNLRKIYLARLHYEMDAIIKMGFEGYFLLVWDYCKDATRRGIARGSAGGSMVSYLIAITEIDPIQYNLYFERFIDVSALDALAEGKITKSELKIPDVDTDFGKLARDAVKQKLIEKHGEKRVAAIGTFQYLWAKGCIKDIGKVLGIPFETTNEMTSRFDKETIEEVLRLGILDNYRQQYPELFEYVEKLAGLPKSFGSHPCGMIIAQQDLEYYAPLSNNNGQTTLENDMHSCDDEGLVKADFLGLRTVDVLYDTLDMLDKTIEYIHPSKINLNDQKVYELFRQGQTTGIFQMESDGMKKALKLISPTKIEHIIATNALYRPASIPYIESYANRVNGREQPVFLHDDLKDILGESFGLMLYQEQLIAIGRLAGLRNPDKLRKATGKKDMKLLQSLEPEVKSGLIKRFWTEEQVNTIWEEMLLFGMYSFNKSHAAAYGLISYMTAYLKVYHPVEFMCATLNSYIGDIDKILIYAKECIKMNIKFEKFNWRNTHEICTVNDNKLSYGLSLIKSVSNNTSTDLNKLVNNEYAMFTDLLIDIADLSINKNQMSILIMLDFFSEFGKNKKLQTVYEMFQKLYGKSTIKKDKISELGIPYEVIARNCEKETDKQLNKCNMIPLIKYVEQTTDNTNFDIQQQLFDEKQSLGFCNSKYDCNSSYMFITDIDETYAPKVSFYNIATGETGMIKCYKKTLYYTANHNQQKCFDVGYIVKFDKTEDRDKRKKVNEEWITTDETEEILTEFTVIKRYKQTKTL